MCRHGVGIPSTTETPTWVPKMVSLSERDLIPLEELPKSKKELSWADQLRPELLYSSVSLHTTPRGAHPDRVQQCGAGGRGDRPPPRPATSWQPQVLQNTSRSGPSFRSAQPRRPPPTGNKSRVRYAFRVSLGGEVFPITQTMLTKASGTLLTELTPGHPAWDPVAEEYFFDRGPGAFPFILDHLIEDENTHFPHCFCPQVILNDLDFWKISPDILPTCCSRIISDYLEELDTLHQLEKAIIKEKPYTDEQWQALSSQQKLKTKIYCFLDEPDTSTYAKVWVGVYTIMVLVSITIACLASVPAIREPTDATHCRQYENMTKKYNTCSTVIPSYMWYTSTVLNAIFLLETILKFIVFPDKKYKFFLNFLNSMDVIAVLLTISTNLISVLAPVYWQNNIVSMASLSAMASVLRVGRIMQSFKHNKGLRVLVLTLKFSYGDLLLLVFLIFVAMLLYSVAIYFAEYEIETHFQSIPEGLWWSLITMTTVGYGDMSPQTLFGYLIGGVCAMMGVVITGSAIPLTANSFEKLTELSKLVGTRR